MLVSLLALVLAFAQVPVQTPDRDANAELAAARQLYANASYEEALERLGRVNPPPALADQVDTYRALGLLALGRSRESEQIIERVLTRNPKYTLDEADVSPRLVIVFRAVRARLLPVTARNGTPGARQLRSQAAQQAQGSFARSWICWRRTNRHERRRSPYAGRRVSAPDQCAGVHHASMRETGRRRQHDGDHLFNPDRDVIARSNQPVCPIMDAAPGGKPGTYQGLVGS